MSYWLVVGGLLQYEGSALVGTRRRNRDLECPLTRDKIHQGGIQINALLRKVLEESGRLAEARAISTLDAFVDVPDPETRLTVQLLESESWLDSPVFADLDKTMESGRFVKEGEGVVRFETASLECSIP